MTKLNQKHSTQLKLPKLNPEGGIKNERKTCGDVTDSI